MISIVTIIIIITGLRNAVESAQYHLDILLGVNKNTSRNVWWRYNRVDKICTLMYSGYPAVANVLLQPITIECIQNSPFVINFIKNKTFVLLKVLLSDTRWRYYRCCLLIYCKFVNAALCLS